jgi:hypothetical protein
MPVRIESDVPTSGEGRRSGVPPEVDATRSHGRIGGRTGLCPPNAQILPEGSRVGFFGFDEEWAELGHVSVASTTAFRVHQVRRHTGELGGWNNTVRRLADPRT